jgi:hypothetical protein
MDPRAEAQELARLWADLDFAVWWTDTKEGVGAKQCSKTSWKKAQRIAELELDAAAGMIAHRIAKKNPILVASLSNLILIDCDSAEDVALFKSFAPPKTRSVATSQGRHFYYRPDADDLPGGIYFEAGIITPKSDCYLVMPPAIHPSGRVYAFENENEIAVLPSAVRRAMFAAAGVQAQETDERLEDDDEVVEKGARHGWLARKVGKLANAAVSEARLVEDALALNQQCNPPKPEAEVKRMAKDFWRRRKSPIDTAFLEEDESRKDVDEAPRPKHNYDADDVRVSDAKSRHVPWLDKPFIQGAAFQILAAKGSTGKGLWTAMLAMQITLGLLPGQSEPGNVAFITSEDTVAQDVKPRLQVAGADMDRCFVLLRDFSMPTDEDWLRGYIAHRNLAAVIIDPVSNHIGGVDGNDEAAIRHALKGLNIVADELNCLILGVRHMRKDAESGALAGVLGSTAWVDLPRQVTVAVRDPEDPSIVHMDVLKQNRAKMGESGRAYQIDGVDIVLDDGVTDNIGRMTLAVDVEFRDLDSIVGRRKNTQKDAIRAAIIATLEANNGEMFVDELDSNVSARIGAPQGSVRNVRSAMTVEYKHSPTENCPLEKIVPSQTTEDKRRRVKLGFVAMREEQPNVEDF